MTSLNSKDHYPFISDVCLKAEASPRGRKLAAMSSMFYCLGSVLPRLVTIASASPLRSRLDLILRHRRSEPLRYLIFTLPLRYEIIMTLFSVASFFPHKCRIDNHLGVGFSLLPCLGLKHSASASSHLLRPLPCLGLVNTASAS